MKNQEEAFSGEKNCLLICFPPKVNNVNFSDYELLDQIKIKWETKTPRQTMQNQEDFSEIHTCILIMLHKGMS